MLATLATPNRLTIWGSKPAGWGMVRCAPANCQRLRLALAKEEGEGWPWKLAVGWGLNSK